MTDNSEKVFFKNPLLNYSDVFIFDESYILICGIIKFPEMTHVNFKITDLGIIVQKTLKNRGDLNEPYNGIYWKPRVRYHRG